MPKHTPTPKIITISSSGLTRKGRAALPLLFKPLYGYLLDIPHKDKLGAERAIAHCTGRTWEEDEPRNDIMGEQWTKRRGLPAPGTLKGVLVIRPAWLTDGRCRADQNKDAYRVKEAELGGYTISRKDVAHFIAEAVLHRWDEFSDKIVNIGY